MQLLQIFENTILKELHGRKGSLATQPLIWHAWPPHSSAAARSRTTSTEHGAWLTTDWATLPSTRRLMPV